MANLRKQRQQLQQHYDYDDDDDNVDNNIADAKHPIFHYDSYNNNDMYIISMVYGFLMEQSFVEDNLCLLCISSEMSLSKFLG